MREILVRERLRIASAPGKTGGIYINFQAQLIEQGTGGKIFVGHFVIHPFDDRSGSEHEVEHKRLDTYVGFPNLEKLRLWVVSVSKAIPIVLEIHGRERTVQAFCATLAGKLRDAEEALARKQVTAEQSMLHLVARRQEQPQQDENEDWVFEPVSA